MSKKKKNKIDVAGASDLLQNGYSLNVKEMNYYQLRISQEEHTHYFWDWYHTTGALVENKKGEGIFYTKNIGTIKDPEEVAILITSKIKEEEKHHGEHI